MCRYPIQRMMQQTNKYALCKFSKTVSTTATCKGISYSTVLIEQIEVKVKITLYIKTIGESKETNKLIDSGGREAMVMDNGYFQRDNADIATKQCIIIIITFYSSK
jgi:hypothetical protein